MSRFTPHKIQESQNRLVLSYQTLRGAVGMLGFFLPAALILWSVLTPAGIQPSISAYFYTQMGEVFVGTLCAIAVFLWSYMGYSRQPGQIISDWGMARVAALGALLTALAPIAPPVPAPDAPQIWAPTLFQQFLGNDLSETLHWLGAASFFAALAVFCLVLFTRGNEHETAKRGRNQLYRICGVTILAAMALIGATKLLPGLGQALAPLRPIFWLETIATFAFAVSWLVKGRAMEAVGQSLSRMRAGHRAKGFNPSGRVGEDQVQSVNQQPNPAATPGANDP